MILLVLKIQIRRPLTIT